MDNRPIGVFDSGLGGLTAVSMYPKLMEHEGLTFSQLVDRLLCLAVNRRKGAY